MNCITWNARGLDVRSRRVLIEHCRSYHPLLIAIIEPKIRFSKIRPSFWNSINMVPFHQNCRLPKCSNIWVAAKPGLDVSLVLSTPQVVAIDCLINGDSIRFAFVHGSNAYVQRRTLWKDILDISTPCLVCMGDFNALRGAHERIGVSPPEISCREFRDFIDAAQLSEPVYMGLRFTWSGRRFLPFHSESVNDRVLISQAFSDKWSALSRLALPRISSDHSPLVLICRNEISSTKPFRFLHMWTLHDQFQSFVRENWEASCDTRCPIFRIMFKLKRLKAALRSWNKTVFGNVDSNIAKLTNDLSDIQARVAIHGYTDDLFEEEVSIQADLESVLSHKSALLRQQSRITWLSDGDRNSKFFHSAIKAKRAKHMISFLVINGVEVYDEDIIADHIVQFYTDLFTAPDVAVDLTMVDDLISPVLSERRIELLSAIPSYEEIKAAVFSMDSNSSPGPDGFGGAFYHSCWDIVMEDIICGVRTFFHRNYLPTGLNSSTVILIPKKEAAKEITDYRPIVLSNFIFKIISKILATRLGEVAQGLVAPSQFGFIPGRNIHDCIALGSEGVNCLEYSDRGRNMACKIDVTKAFDTMRWDFILRVLTAFGFPIIFTSWIYTIFSSARLSILCNGKVQGYFPCTRGVRQGDPLSPILFGLAEEVLSRMISRAVILGRLKPMTFSRYRLFPSHLLYADDILFFAKASEKNADALHGILRDYGAVSGQICNPSKSHIYFGSGVETNIRRCVSRVLGFRQGTIPFVYLGAPLFVGHPKVEHLAPIKDRIINSFSAWKGAQLSMAGRACLISSVIQSSIVHTLMVYRWPITLLKEIDDACRQFLWTGSPTKKPFCTIAWPKVCAPKENGGLGIRSFRLMNESFLAKLAWKIMISDSLGFPLFRSKYVSPTLRPKFIQHTSSIWTSVRKTYAGILDETYCSIGSGESILFWYDDWLGFSLATSLGIPSYMFEYLQHRVSDFFYDGMWHFSDSFVDLFPNIVTKILLLPMGSDCDVRFWKPATHGQVTSRLMYSHMCRQGLRVNWGSWIWDRLIPVRRSLLCWRFIHSRLPTFDFMQRRGFQGPNRCALCLNSPESISHIFWDCPIARICWHGIASWFGVDLSSCWDAHSLFLTAMNWQLSPALTCLWKVGVVSLFWVIWHVRNDVIFNEGAASSFRILKLVKAFIMEVSCKVPEVYSSDWNSYTILRNLGIAAKTKPPPRWISVSWWPPPVSWIKVNIDGSASGAPGEICSGGVFRDHFSHVRGCFHVKGGRGFAFEAELLAAVSAIAIAHERGWTRLWLETDSTYVEGLLSTNSDAVPWKFFDRWKATLKLIDFMDFRVSHIFREGNSSADFMANPDNIEGFWPFAIPALRPFVAKDVSTPFFFRSV